MDYLSEAINSVQKYLAEHSIPNYFYQCLFGELVKIHGARLIVPDKEYLAEYDDDGNIIESSQDDYSYKDQLDYVLAYVTGTAGWHMAFKDACMQCGLMDVYRYYSSLDWVHSDYFDGCIADKTIEVLFSDSAVNDYYLYRALHGLN